MLALMAVEGRLRGSRGEFSFGELTGDGIMLSLRAYGAAPRCSLERSWRRDKRRRLSDAGELSLSGDVPWSAAFAADAAVGCISVEFCREERGGSCLSSDSGPPLIADPGRMRWEGLPKPIGAGLETEVSDATDTSASAAAADVAALPMSMRLRFHSGTPESSGARVGAGAGVGESVPTWNGAGTDEIRIVVDERLDFSCEAPSTGFTSSPSSSHSLESSPLARSKLGDWDDLGRYK